MDQLRKLRGERTQKVKAAKDLVALAKKEDRPLTEDERTQIDTIKAEIEEIDNQISSLEAVIELERSAPAETVVDQTQTTDPSDSDPSDSGASARRPVITGGAPASDRDPYRGFRPLESGGLAEFLHAVILAGKQGTDKPVYKNSRRESRLVPLVAAAGGDEQHGASQQFGGFTVPEGFSARLLMLEMDEDPTQGVTTIPMEVPTVKIPARVDKNHSSSVAGGITAAWSPPTSAITSSRMTLEQIMLSANSLKALAYVDNELLDDSPLSWAALLEAGFRDAVTDSLIRARIDGTGVGEPLGILNSPALISVDTTSQTTGTITGANIVNMRRRVWRYSRAIWIANHDTYEQIASAHLPGTNTDVFLFSPARGTDVPDTLLGRPIIFSEYAKSLSTVGDIMCVVWSEYLVGNLQGVQIAESMHVRFENNENTLRATLRQAGNPWWRSALTPVNGDTLSPYVALATRTT